MIDIQRFSICQDFKVEAAAEIFKKIEEHEKWCETPFAYQTNNADLIAQYSRNFGDFKSKLTKFIGWHVQVIKDGDGRLFNEPWQT